MLSNAMLTAFREHDLNKAIEEDAEEVDEDKDRNPAEDCPDKQSVELSRFFARLYIAVIRLCKHDIVCLGI